jgi:hypothetical protein
MSNHEEEERIYWELDYGSSKRSTSPYALPTTRYTDKEAIWEDHRVGVMDDYDRGSLKADV